MAIEITKGTAYEAIGFSEEEAAVRLMRVASDLRAMKQGRIHDLEQALQHILGLALDGEIPAAVACREIADKARHALDGRA